MSEADANALVQEAEKKLTKFTLFTSKEEVRDKCRDKFHKAATLYKANSNWVAAAAAYQRAADLSQENKSEIDYIEDLNSAGAMLRKADDPRFEDVLGTVVDLYDKNGKYSQAAKSCQVLAEANGPNSEKWYRRAIAYLRSEGSKMTATELQSKMVGRLLEQGLMEQARMEYEAVAMEHLDGHLTRGSARKFLFMALLCRLGSVTSASIMEDADDLTKLFERYQDLDPQFNDLTREHMFIKAAIEALENESEEDYTDAYMEYDAICPLDMPKKKLILRAKQAIRKTDTQQTTSTAAAMAAADEDETR